jgi:lipopolysaccharide export system permease protein
MVLVSIAIVIDLTEKIATLIEKHVSAWDIITKYYLYFIPYIGSLLGPFFIFIAVIFFTSHMAGKSEFIAMLSAGISFNRILYPYFIAATILALIIYFGNNKYVPLSNKARLAFENSYINKIRYSNNKNAHRQIDENTYLYVDNYSQKDSIGYKMTIEKIVNGKLIYKLHADRMVWQRETKKWRLENYMIRTLSENCPDKIVTGPIKDTIFEINPSQIFAKFVRNDEMTTQELNDKIEELRITGTEGLVYFEIEKYRRTAAAFSIYIFTLIAVSIAARKVRGGIGFHLTMGIAMCAAFEVLMKFTTTFSINANLPAIIGVWLPNFIYIFIAIYFYTRAQK